MLELGKKEIDSFELERDGQMPLEGKLVNKVIRAIPDLPKAMSVWEQIKRYGLPQRGLPEVVNHWKWTNIRNLKRAFVKISAAEFIGLAHMYGALHLKVNRAYGGSEVYGLASLRVITNNGVGFIVDAFQNLVELEIMKFHGIGTGTNAENASDSALQTELTTQYNPDNTRATGTTTENAANIYESVGTNAVDAGVAITEHMLASVSASGSGVAFDRSVFSAVNLSSGDSLQSTYRATFNSGG